MPHASGQVIAGLHFLAVAKTLRSITRNGKIPEKVKTKGMLLKRKDSMIIYTCTVDINTVELALNAQRLHMSDSFTLAYLCAGISELLS